MDKISKFFSAIGKNIQKIIDKGKEINLWIALRKLGRGLSSVFGVFARIAVMALLVVILTGTLLFLFGMMYVTHYLDTGNEIDLDQFSLDQTSHIYAKDPDNPDEWIHLENISGQENRVWLSYDEIPENALNAAIAVEDKRFWNHNGVEWKRTVGAFYTLFFGEEDQFGGSSITQQLIKNITGEDEPTVGRKLKEIFRALEFEKKYSKEQIIEWYMNTIYLGQGCNGIQTAAETYFGKPAEELTLAESACLVGITNNPARFDPFLHPNNNKQRQIVILRLMRDQQLISQSEYENAVLSPLVFYKKSETTETSIRSWYIDQALKDLTQDLIADWGWSEQMVTRYIYSGGVNIYLCIDLDIQKILDDTWTDDSCWPVTPDDEPPEASMMICDPYTGDIVAMIGGREKTGLNEFDRTTIAKRQPGSSIKPISIYAQAFELGLITPYTPIDDIPVRLVDGRGWPYNSPRVYEGRMSVLTGVAKSKNTISVQTLQKVGIDRAFDFTKNTMGMSTLVESVKVGDQYLSDMSESPLAFGAFTYGVTVRDMVGAYNSFPNGGIRYKTRTYSHVTDQNGAIVYDNYNDPQVVLKEKSAFYMNQCLQGVVTSPGGTGARARITGQDGVNIPVGGKTGTTTANKDRWFAGYTPYYSAVCWFGYDIPRELSHYTSNPALHMWHQVMQEIHTNMEKKSFFELSTAVQSEYCRDSGMKPTAACRIDLEGNRVSVGTFDKDDVPTQSCNVHVTVNICRLSNRVATPSCPLETCKEASLRRMERGIPVRGLVLADEQYTLRIWPSTSALYSLAQGYYPPLPNTKTPANAFCDYAEHQPGAVIQSPSPPPDTSPTPPPSLPTPTTPTPTPSLPPPSESTTPVDPSPPPSDDPPDDDPEE